jgi:pyruvate dehydrogenase E2 component (dihydrolipoamide acetyltransferase)
MEKGNIATWNKKVGDKVIPGEALCGIETDKAVVDFEMQEEGYIAKILYPEGAKDVPLGEVIAILVDDEDDVAAFANYSGDSAEPAPAKAAPAQAAPAKPSAPAKSYPDHIVLEMPNLSPTMEKGNISTWHKKVGDKVTPGEALCGIQTDKAVVDFEMQEEGYVAKILYSDGAKDVPLGEPVAILVDDEDDIAAFADWTPGAAAGEAPVEAAPAQAQASEAAAPQ